MEAPTLFEWDSVKEEWNVRERNISFAFAAQVFSDACHITLADTRRDYGEPRFLTFGVAAGRLLVVGHTPRGERTRIFSARKANAREQRQHLARLKNKELH